MSTPELEKERRLPAGVEAALRLPATYVLMGLGILALDYATGPYLLFPILFVIPVTLSAWFYSPRWALGLAIALPVGRLVIAQWVDSPGHLGFSLANAVVRILVLALLAYLVGRTARQTRELEAKVSGLVTMCAWSRTIEHEGEWLSFEQYLQRRFGIHTSHGISPAEAEKLRQRLEEERGDA